LTVHGNGTLFLTNFNNYTGDTVVTDTASLFIDGSVARDTYVDSNALLGGIYSGGPANVGRNLTSRGIVSPGDAPGDPETFFVGNNFHNLVNGEFIAEVGGLNPGVDSDLLVAIGTAGIDGGTITVPRLNNFMPLPGDRVTVIEGINGRIGAFDTLVPVNWLGLIQPVDLYDDPFTVDIGFVLSNTFESQGITRNQMAVGAALDDAVLDNCVPNVIAYLGQEPLVNLPYDYDLIAPEELASIYEMGFTQARMQGVNLMQRMDDIRAGSTGFCSSVAMEMPTPSYSKESNGKEVINKNPAPAFVPTPENRWGIWVTGSGQFVNVSNDDDNAPGYDLSNGNFTVGIDYRLLHNLAFGIYGGYDAGVANLTEGGRITTNGGNVGGFATWSLDRFYVDVSGGGTWNNYKTRRAALLGDAVGSTQGTQYNVHGALGYDWHFGCWNVGPRATFQYTDVNIDQFRERGSLAPLNFPDQNEDSLQSTVGFRASYDLHPSKNVIIRPEFSAAWLHEYNDRAYPIDAGFLGCPGGFTVYGPSVGRDGAQVRAGASAQLNPAFAIYVYYDGLLGRGNYSSNGASGGFTWSF
jgi:outer membrane autotransporter protein